MNPKISIITPIYNSTSTLPAYLDAIFLSDNKDFELIIIDDASEDNPIEFIKRYPVIYRKLEKRQGAYHARQEASLISNGSILFFLDADVIIKPNTIGQVASIFVDKPDISALICSYDDSPGATNISSQFKFLYHHYIHQNEMEHVRSFWTGCGAIKKDVFVQVDGFKDSLLTNFNAVSDIELGYKLNQKCFKVYNAKHIQVKHLKRLGFLEWILTDFHDRGLPWMKVLLSYNDFRPNLNLSRQACYSVVLIWGALVSFLFFLSFNQLFGLCFLIFEGAFLILNRQIIKFFRINRGLVFALRSIFYLSIYYFNCGLCFLWGISLFRETKRINR